MALCLCCSSASGSSHPLQRGTVLTANLTWNCSLNERLSLFYRLSLRLNFYWLAQWHQGSWWFREWDWSPVSAVLVQMRQADYLLFDWKCWSPFRWRVTHGFVMWREGGQEKLSGSRSCPSAARSAHASCYTMKGAVSFSSPPQPCGISQITSPQGITALLGPITLKAYKILMRLFYCIWLHFRSTDTLGYPNYILLQDCTSHTRWNLPNPSSSHKTQQCYSYH